jgi:hydrogenase maturation protease
MKTLVLGLGNPILSDDGIGLLVAAELKKQQPQPDLTVIQSELGGLNLLELLSGYDRAFIVDAIQTRRGTPGSVYRFGPESLLGGRHTNSTHGIDFGSTIELGRKLGLDMPEEIVIFAVEVADVTTFSQDCTPAVEAAIGICSQQISQCLTDN